MWYVWYVKNIVQKRRKDGGGRGAKRNEEMREWWGEVNEVELCVWEMRNGRPCPLYLIAIAREDREIDVSTDGREQNVKYRCEL